MAPRSLVKNAADRQQVRDAARKERDAWKRETQDFGVVMGTAEGRRFVSDLLGYCGVFHVNVEDSPIRMAKWEGRRGVGLWALALCDRVPNEYSLMMAERRTEDERAELGLKQEERKHDDGKDSGSGGDNGTGTGSGDGDE